MRIIGAVVVFGIAGCASKGGEVNAPDHLDGLSFDTEVRSAPSESTVSAPNEVDAFIDTFGSRTSTQLARPSAGGADDEAPAPRTGYRDQRAYGDNNQPEWTTERPFATTRTYVLAPGQVELEQGLRVRTPRGAEPDQSLQTSIGFGLPGRIQVDLAENYGRHSPSDSVKHDSVDVEGRWAFANWGRIPLNPALAADVNLVHRGADHIAGAVLVAENLCEWRWAGNVSYDQQMGDVRATEIGLSTGLSHPIIDSRLSAGAEAKYTRTAGIGFHSADEAINELLVGPTLQWRPTDNMHIDLCPLFGFTGSDRRDPRMEIFLIFGFDFGPRRERSDRSELLMPRRR